LAAFGSGEGSHFGLTEAPGLVAYAARILANKKFDEDFRSP